MVHAGRKPTVTDEEIIDEVKDLEIFDEHLNLKPATDEVWVRVSRIFKSKNKCIKSQSIQLRLIKNRNGILSEIKKLKGIAEEIEQPTSVNLRVNFDDTVDSKNDNSSDEAELNDIDFDDYNSGSSSDSGKEDIFKNHPQRKKKLNFNIGVNQNLWNEMKPTEIEEKNGSMAHRLQSGWANIFFQLLWAIVYLPCPFKLSASRVLKHSCNYFLLVKGFCRECKNELIGKCVTNPFCDDKDIVFKIVTLDTRGVNHSKKRRTTGKELQNVKQDLLNEKPFQTRIRKADELMQNNIEPPHLQSRGALKKVRFDAKNAKLGLPKNIKVLNH